jgi:ABC-type transport system involved in cytochrome c biogenesis permease subunit
MLLLAFAYAGILAGGIFARRFAKREVILWRDGVLGMLSLSLIALIPVIGTFVILLLVTFSAGALLLLFFHWAFSREEYTNEML